MSNLTIKDIDVERHLDKDALSDIYGGRNPQTGEMIKIKASSWRRRKKRINLYYYLRTLVFRNG